MSIKEVIPTTPPIPNADVTEPTPQKTSYKYAGKESLSQIIGKSIPEQLIPTKRIGAIFGGIFILILIISAFQFPLSSILSGNVDVAIKVGYPWTFLELKLSETDTSPLKPVNIILDLFLYMIVAYAIEIALNLILKNPLLQSEKELKQKPTIFKDRNPTVAEKVAEKITEKITKEKIIKS